MVQKKFKIFNNMLRNNKVITKKPFLSEIIRANSRSEALKEGMKESRRWNKFSRKTHEGQGFRTKIVKIVEVKGRSFKGRPSKVRILSGRSKTKRRSKSIYETGLSGRGGSFF